MRRSNFPWLTIHALALATALALMFIVKLPLSRLDVPYTFAGDTLDKLVQVETVAETGWLFHNERLGFPYGYDRLDFPRFDSLNYVVMGPIAAATGSSGLAINLYYIISTFAIAFAAFLVFMRLGLRASISFLLALLYALLPYHLLRGVTHVTNGAYFFVPPAMLVLTWLAENKLAPGLPYARRRYWFALAIALLIPLQTPYNGVFFAFTMCVATAIALAHQPQPRALLPACGLLLATLLSFVGEQVPSMLHHWKAGPATHVADRNPIDAEVYSMHLNQVLLPTTRHIVPKVAEAKRGFDKAMRLDQPFYEIRDQYIGALGVFGFAVLLWSLVQSVGESARTPPRPPTQLEIRLRIYAVIAIAILLLAISTGIGNEIAYWLTTKIRAYNRILPFFAFPCLFAAGCALQRALTYIRPPGMQYAMLAITGAIAVLDTAVNPGFDGQRAQTVAEYDSAGTYFRNVEAKLGDGAAVFQLPVVWYPEHPPVERMGDYEEFKPFLLTRSLKFSYGSADGRPGYEWARRIESSQNPVTQLSEAGFSAILIDSRAYKPEDFRQRVAGLTAMTEPPIVDTNRRWWLFPLHGCCARP